MKSLRIWGVSLIAASMLAGCAQSKPEEKPLTTGLDALAPAPETKKGAPAEPIDAATQAKLDLMAQALRNSEVSVDASMPARPVRAREGATEVVTESAEAPPPPAETPASEAPAVAEAAPIPAAPAAVAREALIADLGARLREQARSSSTPAAALLRLAALEILEPKAGESDAAAEASLTPQEAEFLKAWRELFAAARDGLDSSGDLGPLIAQVVGLAERVQASQPLALAESRLCTKVDGFGMFEEIDRRDANGPYVFVAGFRRRAIVYVEVSNFTHEPKQSRGVDGYQVRLSQELALHHLSGEADAVVWQRPFQEINDFSRKRRRDFYITQIIDLPATLGAGSYRLKVSISDKASGAIAEAVIPIEFVAERE